MRISYTAIRIFSRSYFNGSVLPLKCIDEILESRKHSVRTKKHLNLTLNETLLLFSIFETLDGKLNWQRKVPNYYSLEPVWTSLERKQFKQELLTHFRKKKLVEAIFFYRVESEISSFSVNSRLSLNMYRRLKIPHRLLRVKKKLLADEKLLELKLGRTNLSLLKFAVDAVEDSGGKIEKIPCTFMNYTLLVALSTAWTLLSVYIPKP